MNKRPGSILSALLLTYCLIHTLEVVAAEKQRLQETPLEMLTKIEILPSQVFLGGQRNTQRLVVEGHYADGFAEDLTSLVAIHSDNPAFIRVDGAVAYPVASGVTGITAKM